jgi:hypothetical protein
MLSITIVGALIKTLLRLGRQLSGWIGAVTLSAREPYPCQKWNHVVHKKLHLPTWGYVLPQTTPNCLGLENTSCLPSLAPPPKKVSLPPSSPPVPLGSGSRWCAPFHPIPPLPFPFPFSWFVVTSPWIPGDSFAVGCFVFSPASTTIAACVPCIHGSGAVAAARPTSAQAPTAAADTWGCPHNAASFLRTSRQPARVRLPCARVRLLYKSLPAPLLLHTCTAAGVRWADHTISFVKRIRSNNHTGCHNLATKLKFKEKKKI